MITENLSYIIGAAIVALLIAVFHYFYKSKNKEKSIVLLTFLRFITLFALFLLLINPKVERDIVKIIKPNLIVAVDNSSSIKHLNQQENVLKLIKDLKSNKALNNKFELDFFSFSDDVQLLDSLSFEISQTNISKPFRQFNELYKGKISPIILITDGNQTFGADYEYTKINQPVFPIVVGDTTKYADLKIAQQNVNRYAYLKNKFPVEVFLNYDGEKSVNATFSIFKGKQRVYSKNISFSKDNNSRNLSFYLPTTQGGTHYYTSQISYLDNEKNKINNTKNFVVEVIDEQSKILILTSFLHPDIGALKKSIESNKQRKVTIKSVGDKFQLKEYQLVMLYQPTNDFTSVFLELEKEKINSFIITGSKTDWNFLNNAQHNFSKKTINQTENYLPVFNQSFATFITDDIGFNNFSPLIDKFGEVKFNIPFESLLFQQVGNFVTEKPLLATYESDSRRGAILFGENSWRWRMTSKLDSKSFTDYNNYINKIIQYLSSNKKSKRLTIDYKSIYYANENVRVTANYLDKNYMFDSGATLWLTVNNRETNENKRLPFSSSRNSYLVSLSGLSEGNYDFNVSVENQNVREKGSFKILKFDVEQQFTNANAEKLKSISQKTEGIIYFENTVTKLTSDLLIDKRFVSIHKVEKKLNSLIDWKWLLSVIILSLSIEWFIRKYKGLI
ncbi:MAG: VWA domain-containing protein [Flavobacteriaceae bacterium]|nr:VWA domain-containing protein [Flavobacteriaceae bacterium]